LRTEELIVGLARLAGPVRPLPSPSIRLAQWTAATAPLMALAVIVLGPRTDVITAVSQPAFLGLATVTIGTALLSAASALVLAIPGAERSVWQRAVPLLAGAVWGLWLAYLLVREGAAFERVMSFPFHMTCLVEIAGLSIVPGWTIFVMLRRAAPLEPAWTGALAALAAVAGAAAATQLLCPVDDPAHQFVGHLLPVVVLSMLGTIAGRRFLNWPRRG
jgi:hypothetical protein